MTSTREVEVVPIGTVTPLDRNPRTHPERQIAEMMRSIEQFGQYRPLVVDEVGSILAGNGLYLAMSRLGIEEITVIRVLGLTHAAKQKLILADNRLGNLARDDMDVIEEMLRELDDFEVPGYDPEMIAQIVADADAIVAQAEGYGTLGDAEITAMQARSAEQEATNASATVGTPPAPYRPSGAPVDHPSTCPTCGQAWL